MALSALLVAIVSALAAISGLAYSRRSAKAADKSAEAAEKSADAAAVTARLDVDRRHSELTPRFRITCEPAGGPTPEQVARQIWGLWRFIPHTGPGAGTSPELTGADDTGRSTLTAGLPVGEQLPFFLEPNRPPSWSQWTDEGWENTVGSQLRLQLDCRRDGWEPWSLPCEIQIVGGTGNTTLPPGALAQDELASTQRAELQAAQRLREREQATHVGLTYDDMPDEQARSVVQVANNSHRPIFDVAVKFAIVKGAPNLLAAGRVGQMSSRGSGGMTLEASATRPGYKLDSIRAGCEGGFVFSFLKAHMPEGAAIARFTDDNDRHWQLDQDHHLERLNDRDW